MLVRLLSLLLAVPICIVFPLQVHLVRQCRLRIGRSCVLRAACRVLRAACRVLRAACCVLLLLLLLLLLHVDLIDFLLDRK